MLSSAAVARSSFPYWPVAAAAAVLAAGCGFGSPKAGPGDGQPPLPDTPDPPFIDAPPIDAPPIDTPPAVSCMDRWRNDTVILGAPTLIAELMSPGLDRDPYLTPDELTIYFSTHRDATMPSVADVYKATRTSLAAPFGTPQREAGISSAEYDSRFSMSADQLIGVVASTRPAGENGSNVWIATRGNKNAPFGTFDAMAMGLANVNSNDEELDPELSADGLRIYLAVGVPQRIAVSERSSVTGSFGSPQQLAGVNGTVSDADPSLSPDERVIVFSSTRGSGDGDLYYSKRTDKNATFAAPIRLQDVSSNSANDGDPHLSPDGCRLYFASDRSGNWELYVSTVTP
jgi:WD40-like Beta Propeller Repeat